MSPQMRAFRSYLQNYKNINHHKITVRWLNVRRYGTLMGIFQVLAYR